MSRWEGMRVGVAIDPAPFAFRSFAADEEFYSEHYACKPQNAEEFNDFPVFPKLIAEEPKDEERSEPKPRIARVGKEGGYIPQKTRLFSHTHLAGESGIEFKDGTKTHFVFAFAFEAVFAACFFWCSKSSRINSS